MQMIPPYTYVVKRWALLSQDWRAIPAVFEWFGDNFMKLNADKCHLFMLGKNSNQQATLNTGDSVIENTYEEKLLGVVIDKNYF